MAQVKIWPLWRQFGLIVILFCNVLVQIKAVQVIHIQKIITLTKRFEPSAKAKFILTLKLMWVFLSVVDCQTCPAQRFQWSCRKLEILLSHTKLDVYNFGRLAGCITVETKFNVFPTFRMFMTWNMLLFWGYNTRYKKLMAAVKLYFMK